MMLGSFGTTMAVADSKELQVLTRQVAALIDEVERLKITVETLTGDQTNHRIAYARFR
jgi:hypothetical protein